MATWQEVEKFLIQLQLEKNANGIWNGEYGLGDRSQMFTVFNLDNLEGHLEEVFIDFDLLYITSPIMETKLVHESSVLTRVLLLATKPPFGILNTPVNVLAVVTTIPYKSININELQPILEKTIGAVCARADFFEELLSGQDNW